MGFELLCMAVIALFVGMAICFGGYRWFILLLPIFGFVFGFGLGLDTMQSLFGAGSFATVTGWVVGFIVGLIFAVLSYLFYFIGVVLLGGALGYALGVGFMGLIGIGALLVHGPDRLLQPGEARGQQGTHGHDLNLVIACLGYEDLRVHIDPEILDPKAGAPKHHGHDVLSDIVLIALHGPDLHRAARFHARLGQKGLQKMHPPVDGVGGQHHFRQEQEPVGEILAHLLQGCDQPLVQQTNRVGSFGKIAFDKLRNLAVNPHVSFHLSGDPYADHAVIVVFHLLVEV